MEISSSSLALSSAHAASCEEHVRESLRVQLPNGARAPLADAASISGAPCRTTNATDRVPDDLPTTREELELLLLQRLLEELTGRKLDLDALRQLRKTRRNLAADPEAASAPTPADASPQGPGLVYDRVEQRVEQESVSFSAAGRVRTADGRDIEFTVSLSMSRSFAEEHHLHLEAGDTRALKDPLVLNFGGGSADLGESRFQFDLDADGRKEHVPLVGSSSGLLALDSNGNGRVDDGRELFGPQSGSGFNELRALDEDGNGWIDARDPAFHRLAVWSPDAEGGGSLSSLAERGIGAINVLPVETPFEMKDGTNRLVARLRESSVYLNEDGTTGTVQQVDLTA